VAAHGKTAKSPNSEALSIRVCASALQALLFFVQHLIDIPYQRPQLFRIIFNRGLFAQPHPLLFHFPLHHEHSPIWQASAGVSRKAPEFSASILPNLVPTNKFYRRLRLNAFDNLVSNRAGWKISPVYRKNRYTAVSVCQEISRHESSISSRPRATPSDEAPSN
jgi:hypothetical protein